MQVLLSSLTLNRQRGELVMTIGKLLQQNRLDLLELPRYSNFEQHFVIKDADAILQLCHSARECEYDLCTLVAVDERLRVEQTFKLYYVLSASKEDALVILEYLLPDPIQPTYPSIAGIYPSAIPFEMEIYDLFGLIADGDDQFRRHGYWLHPNVYPDKLYPLRRTRPIKTILENLSDSPQLGDAMSPLDLPEGMLILPVGPIHAGIIEAGHFPFYVAGEVIEQVPLRLGYKHRGVEKLFETDYILENGWELAEKVSGDSSFAHSLAYCQAVENIANIDPPHIAQLWRGFFLELERIYNHISDTALLATGLAYEKSAAEISVLREAVVQINERLTGNRLLRGLNRPGGVILPLQSTPLTDTEELIEIIVEEYLEQANGMIANPECRNRMIGTGVLSFEDARDATGLARRASGWIFHDFRLKHPQGIYEDPAIQEHLRATVALDDQENVQRKVPLYSRNLEGDVQARLAMRIAEVETSGKLIRLFVKKIIDYKDQDELYIPVGGKLENQPNMEIGLGYVEGWRGNIMYFVAKGPENTIFRCKVSDPSVLNWHVFPKAVARKPKNNSNDYWENILADFPIINKSFNLSYAGHDL
jgi:Ni,Fe-hydrogenase III large subunit/Ni,Fe-hydrogenase III component G